MHCRVYYVISIVQGPRLLSSSNQIRGNLVQEVTHTQIIQMNLVKMNLVGQVYIQVHGENSDI